MFSRFCHIKHKDLTSKIHDFTEFGPHSYWTCEEYDRIASIIEEEKGENEEVVSTIVTEENLFEVDEITEPQDEEFNVDYFSDSDNESEEDIEEVNNNRFGQKGRCPFNQLEAFHCVYSMPPDILHDLQEGVIALDYLAILKVLITKKKYFTQDEYNNSLKKHEFKKSESNDRPELINLKKKKLRGKAFSVLVHFRNFGFVIKRLVKTSDIFNEECYQLLLLLYSIVEYLMAPAIRNYELSELHEEIIKFLNLRKKLFQEYPDCFQTPKPKTHYIFHYPEAYEKYGPPVGISTARYEAKHRTAKGLAQSGKNFINITKTLSVRQQMRHASVLYNGLYSMEDVELPEVVKRKTEFQNVLDNSSILSKVRDFMDEESVFCDQIKFLGQNYKNDDIIILEILSRDCLKVGLIQGIIFKEGSVYFVVHIYEAYRNEQYKYFESETFTNHLYFALGENIQSYKPLIKHGTALKLSSPGPSPSQSPCPNRPPSRIKVPQKRKKKDLDLGLTLKSQEYHRLWLPTLI